MKKYLLTAVLFIFACQLFSQNSVKEPLLTSVEERIFGIQSNLLEVFVYGERKLSSAIALRAEAGLVSSIFSYSETYFFERNTGFISSLQIAVEPRWYYTLKRRVRKGKDYANNNGHFMSIRTDYTHGYPVLTNIDRNSFSNWNSISVIPTFGMRRTWWNHFDFELGLGAGYSYQFLGDRNDHGGVIRLHLRLGYKF